MIGCLLFLAGLQGQVQPKNDPDYQELDAKTRPLVEVGKFKNLPCISVSQSNHPNEKTKKPESTRVYRFTYKANYDEEAKKLLKEFPKSDGWTVVSKPKDGLILDRQVKSPKITYQAILLMRGKVVRDETRKGHARVVKDLDWVWVVINERLVLPKKG